MRFPIIVINGNLALSLTVSEIWPLAHLGL